MKKRYKYGLIGFVFGLIGLFNFSIAGTFTIEGNVKDGFLDYMTIPQKYFDKNFTINCVFSSENLNCAGGNAISFTFGFAQVYNANLTNSTLVNTNNSYSIDCDNLSDLVLSYDFSTYTPPSGPYANFRGVSFLKFNSLWYGSNLDIPYSCTFVGGNILSGGGSSSCPEVNTGEILSGYILESEIDTNYCVGNGYCPTNECTGSLDPVQSGNWSSLFINDIQHIGAGLINITIPEEIEWDYIYTGNGDEFDLNVKGYNVDSDYIEGIINTQNSKPSLQDFNNIITGLIPLFVPGLCIILLIHFIYLFIKKIF